jgi:hypothetical protein
MIPSHIIRKKIKCHGFIFFLVIYEGVLALFSSWLYVRVSWLYLLPCYMSGCHGFIFFLVMEENEAMTPSHITRKKIKP